MPSLITHYLFAKHYSPTNDQRELLGTQGPDPLFYYARLRPLEEHGKDIRKFGTTLHSVDPLQTFEYLLEYARLEENETNRQALLSYIKGFAKHYALDRCAHPYIFYKTGFPTKEGEKEETFSYYHSLMETNIDVLIKDHYQDNSTYNDMLSLNDHDLILISRMYYFIAQKMDVKYFKIDTFKKAVNDMILINNIINSKYKGFRKKIFETILNKSIINAMSHPFTKDAVIKKDFLNLEKNNYYSVVDNSLIGNDNFYEIMNHAGSFYLELLDALKKAYHGDKLDLEKTINIINFDGIKCYENMIYYSSIF